MIREDFQKFLHLDLIPEILIQIGWCKTQLFEI